MDMIRELGRRIGKGWQAKQERLKQDKTTWRILAVLLLVALGFSVIGILITGGDWGGLLLNWGAELGGAVMTFVLINRIIGGSEERQHLKADLIVQLGSRDNATTIRAAEELGRHGWLYDGSLKGISLDSSNLRGAPLQKADLRGTLLWNSNLRGASLGGALLQKARLQGSDLEGAGLQGTRLQGARLDETNLKGVSFAPSHLWQEHPYWAPFDENSTLPDGTQWTPDTDMRRFTDPTHPDFWRSDDPNSPAYRGEPAEE